MGLGGSLGPCLHMCLCDSSVVCVSFCVLVSYWFVHHRPHEALAQDRALTALGKVLYLLDRILDGQVTALGRGWGGGHVVRGRAQDVPATGGLSRGGLGGILCQRQLILLFVFFL